MGISVWSSVGWFGRRPRCAPEVIHLTRVRDLLAEQLAAHDYDLGQALLWMVQSAPFKNPLPKKTEPPS